MIREAAISEVILDKETRYNLPQVPTAGTCISLSATRSVLGSSRSFNHLVDMMPNNSLKRLQKGVQTRGLVSMRVESDIGLNTWTEASKPNV